MLKITIPLAEGFDEEKEEFIILKSQTLELEHSLASISKWESKWKKPFFRNESKTSEETLDYIRCMNLTPDVAPEVFLYVTNKNIEEITIYIEDSMTATWFSEDGSGGADKEIVTSEIIYYWMTALNIPLECEYWHINRLLTLIRVCSIKNSPPRKMSTKEITTRNAALNEARKKKWNTKG